MKKFKCKQCIKRYRSKAALNRHLRYDCGKEPMFCCLYCSYRAYQKIHLQRHYKSLSWYNCDTQILSSPLHSEVSWNSNNIINDIFLDLQLIFPCKQCGRHYHSKSNLGRHITYECGGKKQFQCTCCMYKCKRRDTLKRHYLSVHREKYLNYLYNT
ncbi:hypothetical protein RI129_008150 [Pyrocoelia pectoralis]|uniref:C2H2-type domain-containing protein n=1 Tax=Pyrocoelia pectoralis TaxID=417401 RepID=A0AAN7V854_9COLE